MKKTSNQKTLLVASVLAIPVVLTAFQSFASDPVPVKSIIGLDDRSFVSSPESSMFSPVGMVLGVWNEEYGICTGTLIAEDIVVTAAHCITDKNGEWANKVYFAPSLSSDWQGVHLPFDYAAVVDAVVWYDDIDDLAFVKIDMPLAYDAGYYKVITADEAILSWYFDYYGPVWGYNAGYPTDKDLEMWYSYCSVREWLSYYGQMGSDCDSLEGSSGSPFIVADFDDLYVAGVLTAQVGPDYAWAGYGYSYRQGKNLVQPIPESYYSEAMSKLR